MTDVVRVAPEVAAAPEGAVALESTVIAHGLPHPENERAGLRLEAVVREEGAVPATVGVLAGVPTVGIGPEGIGRLARARRVRKCSLRDLPLAAARREDGATTVAATLLLAHRAGLRVFATGGIGGVHREAARTFDLSADLTALGRYPLVVVCAGAKSILDLPATRQALETLGVPVLGWRTEAFPAFYSRESGLRVDLRVETADEVVEVARHHWRWGARTAVLLTVPPPPEVALPRAQVEAAVEAALAEAGERGIEGAELTPFLLKRLVEATEGASLRVNLALLEENARVAARVARALASEG